MKKKEYVIEFNKLKNGINHLEFSLNDKFMELMEGSLRGLDVTARTEITKTEGMYHVTAELTGKVTLECDLCLDDYVYPVKGHSGFIIKLSEVERYDDDEIVYITPATIDFDLSQFLFDSMMLSIPLKKICAQGGKDCNEQVISKLAHIGEETNEETGESENANPAWDKLKGLIDPKEQ